MRRTLLLYHAFFWLSPAQCEGLTFENGTDVFPYGYGPGSVELSQCQLHVKKRHTTKDGHQNIGNEESTCTEMHESMHVFYMEVMISVSVVSHAMA